MIRPGRLVAVLTLAGSCLLGSGLGIAQVQPRTAAEASGYLRTSTSAEVVAWVTERTREIPGASVRVFAQSFEGRDLQHVVIPATGPEPLRVLINANIHGGEVEGKEAVQILLREFAGGAHQELRARVELHLVPNFNPDGNDEIHPGNRVNQNGPDQGVGRRANSQGFDLNRDFVKLESPEARGLVRLMDEVDPHLFMDLHTTNGSYHGYHVTYSPGLNINQDPVLSDFLHDEFMPEVRRRSVQEHGVRAFDYGNFPSSRTGQDPSKGWWTFSGDARLAWNYAGLRNRLSVLCEAYSYLPFEERIRVTRGFVLSTLSALVSTERTVRALTAAADTRLVEGEGQGVQFQSTFVEPTEREILVGGVEKVSLPEGRGTRLVAKAEYEPVQVPVAVRFRGERRTDFPAGWAIQNPTSRMEDWLVMHGLQVWKLRTQHEVRGQVFRVQGVSRPRARFQGHQLVTVQGAWVDGVRRLAPGTLWVPARQPLARVAAHLLEPEGEDSLTTWNGFDDQLGGEGSRSHPVVRVSEDLSRLGRRRLGPREPVLDRIVIPGNPEQLPKDRIQVRCRVPGVRRGGGDFEAGPRWEGRQLEYAWEGRATDRAETALSWFPGNNERRAITVEAIGPVLFAEIQALGRGLRERGFDPVYFVREPE